MTIYAKVLFLGGLALGAQGKRDLENYTFEKFVSEFKHNWSGAEAVKRRAIFEEELARVKIHNKANRGWKEDINRFSAMTVGEKASTHGRNKNADKSHKPENLKPFPAGLKMKAVSELPESVDWRDQNVVSPVKDQGHCGSCWAFASTATLESHIALQTGLLFDLSPQQVAMCSPNPNNCGGSGGCNGATSEIAFDYVAGSAGIVQEYEIGYSAYYGANSDCAVTDETLPKATITGYTQLPANDYTSLMNAIAQVGPIAISVDASTFHSYTSGIFNGCNQTNPDINHAVTLVGYGVDGDQKYWLVRNSWSPTWGEDGYIRVLRTDDDDNVCGLDIYPHDGSACDGQDDYVTACGTCGILFDSSYPLGGALA